MECVVLKSGRQIGIRPVMADDGPRLLAAYELLSEESKYQRFLGPKPSLSPRDVRYLTDLDGFNHFALVATPADDPDRFLGVGRCVRLRSDPRAAEFAITVGDPYQGEGIATELLSRLADQATELGIERVTATMLADNVPAHRLMRRLARDWHGHTPNNVVELAVSQRNEGPTDEVEVAPLAA
jgi:RimJ/RimL family protein N-acetyltransferase